MRVYENKGQQVFGLLSLFALLGGAGIAYSAYAAATANALAVENGLIVGGIAGLCALAMEFYARRYVISIDVTEGETRICARSLTGFHHDAGKADLSAVVKLAKLDMSANANAAAPNPIDAGTTAHHWLTLTPGGRRYVVDVTADPDLGAKLAAALPRER